MLDGKGSYIFPGIWEEMFHHHTYDWVHRKTELVQFKAVAFWSQGKANTFAAEKGFIVHEAPKTSHLIQFYPAQANSCNFRNTPYFCPLDKMKHTSHMANRLSINFGRVLGKHSFSTYSKMNKQFHRFKLGIHVKQSFWIMPGNVPI